jgi:hypothetical protein
MSSLEAALKAQQDTYERMKLDQGSFERWSLQQTSDYWRKVLDTVNLSLKDRQEVLNRFYDAERGIRLRDFTAEVEALDAQKAQFSHNYDARVAIAQLAAEKIRKAFGAGSPESVRAQKSVDEELAGQKDQQQKLADIQTQVDTATAKHHIDMAKLAADQDLALRRTSAQQAIAVQRDLVQQETAILRDEVQKRIDIMSADPNADPVKLAELKARLLTVERDYQKQVTELDNQAAKERQKYAIQAADAIQSNLADALASLTDKTKTAKEKWDDFMNSIVRSLSRVAANKLAEGLLGGGTTGGGFLASAMSALFGSPVPALAEGTNYVPKTGLYTLHQGEAVTPARYNTTNNRGGTVNMAVHINGPVDTRSLSQIKLAVARGLQRASYRDG